MPEPEAALMLGTALSLLLLSRPGKPRCLSRLLSNLVIHPVLYGLLWSDGLQASE